MAKIRCFAVFLCLIAFFILPVFSASVSGIVYDENINPVKGAVVSLEKGQALYSQMITNQSGAYEFSFPAGEYRLVASLKKDNQTLQTPAMLNLSENDSVRIDLIVMPELGVEVPEIMTIEEEKPFAVPVEEPQTDWVLVGFVFGLIAIAIIVFYLVWKRQTESIKKEIEEIKRKKEEPPLGKFFTDEERVYQLIRRRGEIPQKHVVIETGFSKAKVTLILKKLEKLGKIKRTGIGREKIIRPVD